MCVSCRNHAAKRALIRVVRTPDGTVEIDPSGKRDGRGAYLCDQSACWERALSIGALGRALNLPISEDMAGALSAFAASLPATPAAVTTDSAPSNQTNQSNAGGT